VVLGLEELEKIYSVYHGSGNNNDFLQSKAVLREKNSNIPLLKEESLFFNCYDNSVYESVLDDLRK
jgi:hypothetical protein